MIVLANAMLQTAILRERIHSPISAVQLDVTHDRTEQLSLLLTHEILDRALLLSGTLNFNVSSIASKSCNIFE
jgi:hypothetical protein